MNHPYRIQRLFFSRGRVLQIVQKNVPPFRTSVHQRDAKIQKEHPAGPSTHVRERMEFVKRGRGEDPAAGKDLYEAQYSDFLRRMEPGLRKFWRNWRNCAKKIFAQIRRRRRRMRQICAKIFQR